MLHLPHSEIQRASERKSERKRKRERESTLFSCLLFSLHSRVQCKCELQAKRVSGIVVEHTREKERVSERKMPFTRDILLLTHSMTCLFRSNVKKRTITRRADLSHWGQIEVQVKQSNTHTHGNRREREKERERQIHTQVQTKEFSIQVERKKVKDTRRKEKSASEAST